MLVRWGVRYGFDLTRNLWKNGQFLRWNHYKSLGLTPSASMADVKAAYYKLSKIYHPDRNKNSEASVKKFRDIVSAYEVLGKTDSRRKYDQKILGKFETGNSEFGPRKKGNKKYRKNSSHKGRGGNFNMNIHSKYSQRSNGVRKFRNKQGQDDLETFVLRAIPLVVACFMYSKKQ